MRMDNPSIFQAKSLHTFLVLAEELHFGRAAKRLHISQPPLSQQIQRLEAAVGTALFVRDTRNVQLSPAGRVLQNWLLQQQLEEENLLRRLRQADGLAHVRLGFSSSVAYKLLPRLIGQLPSALRLSLEESHSRLLIEHVRQEKVDVALLRKPAEAIGKDLRFTLIEREALCVALHPSHALVSCAQISVEQLNGEDFIDYQPDQATYFRERVHGLFTHFHVYPNMIDHSTLPTILSLVMANRGIALVPECARALFPEQVVFRPLLQQHEKTMVELYCVRRQSNAQLAVLQVEQMALDVCQR